VQARNSWEAEMKRNLILWVLVAVLAVPAAWGQFTTFKGQAKDAEGKPITGAIVTLQSKDTGRKYDLKTDKDGKYYSLGIQTGIYDIKISKNGQLLFNYSGVRVALGDETVFNIDLKKEQQQSGISEEQQKQIEAAKQENAKVKNLNDMLAQAKTAEESGNLEQAVQLLTQATATDSTRDLLWFKLADYERLSANKLASPSEKAARYQKAAEDYKKAIAIKPTGAYYNNLGEAQVKSGDTAGAIASYNEAAQIDPTNAAQYFYNEGAVLTNTGKVDEAIAAFDRAIQADPAKADAYYWKGVNLLGKATMKGNKMEAPPGTSEAFNKYLELQPSGQFAEPAKQMLTSIGATIETSFGKTKASTKTKK
jgi:tetratricopeptide (TPR) repeat protein